MKINKPEVWAGSLPVKSSDAHKYHYGHAVIYGAPELTGATRLAASAAARMGAGLVTVVSPQERADVYRASLPAHIMVRDELAWDSKKVSARLYGSGGLARGVKIRLNRPCVIDADALLSMPDMLNDNCVLTPHEGEFVRAFPNIEGSRDEKALKAAQKCGAVIVLKGQGSVIAHPDGRVVMNEHDSPYLASAGTGDVLTGMICGLMAQGMPSFEAACAAVWMHGDAGQRIGIGLVASDLIKKIPEILKETLGKR